MNSEEMPDPRSRPDFKPAYLPLCDDGAWPPATSDNVLSRRLIEFAAIYYTMNVQLAAAETARCLSDKLAENEALQKLCELSAKRDALEDRHAPGGFLAEPILSNGLYVNLIFTWSGKAAPVLCARRFEMEFTL